MERDARDLSPATGLDTDLCIVGAGPAGIAIACAFMGSAMDVVMLESGGRRNEPALQELNQGSVEGDPYAGLHLTRHRQLGGAVNMWNTKVENGIGGKFVPLDRHDLEQGNGGFATWPLAYAELEKYYQRAQAFCGLGFFAYDAEHWQSTLGTPPALPDQLVNRVYQFGRSESLIGRYLRDLAKAGNVRLYHHATMRGLRTDRGGRRIVAVEATSGHNTPFQVRAKCVVLAGGAIENARLLLLSEEALVLGESRQWVGRCFMEHPRDKSLQLTPQSVAQVEALAFFRRARSADGVTVGGRIAVAEQAVSNEGVPAGSVSLIPQELPQKGTTRSHPRFRLVVNLEQGPNPENQIVLGNRRDSLGLPRPVLRWRWRESEQLAVDRLRNGLVQWLGGLGSVEAVGDRHIDPNAHHHAGTTRMHQDPAYGVVDSSCRVHGTDNLYVAGASTFPTSGWANPTLTIVAMALRLADRLRADLAPRTAG